MADQYELEEQAIYDAYASGEITDAELNRQLRELQRDQQEEARGRAEEAAAEAYRNELERW